MNEIPNRTVAVIGFAALLMVLVLAAVLAVKYGGAEIRRVHTGVK